MELSVIFDGTCPSTSIAKSENFINGQFLIFDSPGLEVGEGIQLGLSIIIEIPLIGNNSEKLIPTTLISTDLSLVLDTNLIYYLPREISESNLNCFCYFNSSVSTALRVYVYKSKVTQESIEEKISEIIVKQNREIERDIALITNELAQNTSISLLSGSLIPITGGTSLSAQTPLIGGTAILNSTLKLLGGF